MNNYKKKILLPNLNVTIEGKTVLLKPLTENEINEQYVLWLNDPALNEFLEVRHKKQTIEDIYDYVNNLRSIEGCEMFAVFTKNGHVRIGNITITPGHIDSEKSGIFSFGIFIGDKDALKVGLGAEAGMMIVDFLFSKQKVRKLEEGALAKNYKSRRMLEMLGFKEEGVLRKHSILPSGEINDVFLYGMFKEEWEKTRVKFSALLTNMKVNPI